MRRSSMDYDQNNYSVSKVCDQRLRDGNWMEIVTLLSLFVHRTVVG